ncbi:Dienelactone hydrolase family protein [Taphrina deformans PYCC 5710]|uniref:Dienelactone hydrolase family protein n=1 Tax=Taphrina deformans (strain PYCC 5710 / ATCC 11124 / CBS 356.35 / IMI 108563 / JCM 9778 / NBRC 8474) TaxID=1097556 RepID=R4X7W8_TAPDE|nr:Dienelactone hydrolase family protein [Taphrina deformans PYCC 5710]|eukprot:CCG81530.1 Dienelactone hydrolase family protein [Taphrina deformans PYCC 5710]
MSANTNAACCSIPPVESSYQPKGSYKTLGGLKTYVVGDPNSNRVITIVYDIFGFHPSTQQGADILASQGFLVVMPDFFKGSPLPQELYPPTTDEAKQKVQAFFAGPAAPADNLKALSTFATAASKEFTKVKYHAILGFCWGGKIAILASDKRDVFQATAVVHPAMVDPADARAISNPIIVLPSKDEPAEDIKKFQDNLQDDIKSKSVFKTYDTMHHGWAAARADLSDSENKKKFAEAYEDLANFFNKNVSK